ncbi:unnamed protein product [Diamesa hyperborea]
MHFFVTVAVLAVVSLSSARPQQQQLDPAYLRQYYAQIGQQTGAQGAPRSATPIFESAEPQQQYQQQGLKNFPRPGQQQQTQSYVAPEVRQYQPQPQQQPQQAQYQQPKAQPKPKRPVFSAEQQQAEEENAEDYEPSPSYQFGFDVKDDEFTNYQNRKESREGNVIKGSYSVVDSDGFIRTVTYTADPKEGFKAEVVREPTNIVVKVPEQKPPQGQQAQQEFRQPGPRQQPAPQQAQQQYTQQAQPSQYRQQQPQARQEYQQYQQQ